MILAEGTSITAIRNKGIKIRWIEGNIKIRTIRCKDIISTKTMSGWKTVIKFFE